jgi:hypothetical protein
MTEELDYLAALIIGMPQVAADPFSTNERGRHVAFA